MVGKINMSELRFETLSMPGAEVGPNPLPPLGPGQEEGPYDPAKYPGFSDQMLRDMAYGHPANYLPYTMQDCYSRELKERDFAGAVCRHARSLPVHCPFTSSPLFVGHLEGCCNAATSQWG